MNVYCKKTYSPFIKGEYYNIYTDFHTIFEYRDFISIKDYTDTKTTKRYRFRLNHSTQYAEGYIGENELYFFDYFCDIKEERKKKLEQIKNVTKM